MYKAFLYNSYIIKKKYYNLAKVFLYTYNEYAEKETKGENLI